MGVTKDSLSSVQKLRSLFQIRHGLRAVLGSIYKMFIKMSGSNHPQRKIAKCTYKSATSRSNLTFIRMLNDNTILHLQQLSQVHYSKAYLAEPL